MPAHAPPPPAPARRRPHFRIANAGLSPNAFAFSCRIVSVPFAYPPSPPCAFCRCHCRALRLHFRHSFAALSQEAQFDCVSPLLWPAQVLTSPPASSHSKRGSFLPSPNAITG
ncbi:uncharacterized protein VTP21DRAFT_9219 [Calcarisporiella thermophila]|uniref:uncharacterized protein n=1 Tax=Calcarisporiella thermophila TaxID=911321 RepID=UPI00374405A4